MLDKSATAWYTLDSIKKEERGKRLNRIMPKTKRKKKKLPRYVALIIELKELLASSKPDMRVFRFEDSIAARLAYQTARRWKTQMHIVRLRFRLTGRDLTAYTVESSTKFEVLTKQGKLVESQPLIAKTPAEMEAADKRALAQMGITREEFDKTYEAALEQAARRYKLKSVKSGALLPGANNNQIIEHNLLQADIDYWKSQGEKHIQIIEVMPDGRELVLKEV